MPCRLSCALAEYLGPTWIYQRRLGKLNILGVFIKHTSIVLCSTYYVGTFKINGFLLAACLVAVEELEVHPVPLAPFEEVLHGEHLEVVIAHLIVGDDD